MYFSNETSLLWVISLGVKLWLVNFQSLHICQSYHIYAKYMINIYITPNPKFKTWCDFVLLNLYFSVYCFVHFYSLFLLTIAYDQ